VLEAKYSIQNREVFQTYINNHNHCEAPPVSSKKSALCHSKRHVSNMDGHSDRWKKVELTKQGNTWVVTFTEESGAGEEFSLTLNADTAQWESLSQQSHVRAIQELSSQNMGVTGD